MREKMFKMWNRNDWKLFNKIEGAGYGILMATDDKRLFANRIGKPKVAICPSCDEVSIYIENTDNLG